MPQKSKNRNRTTIGERIRERRLERNIAQIELAQRIGRCEREVRRIERGEVTIEHELVLALARELDMPSSKLVAD